MAFEGRGGGRGGASRGGGRGTYLSGMTGSSLVGLAIENSRTTFAQY